MLFDFKAIIPQTKVPFLNEPTATVGFITTKPANTYDNLDWWVERTPEAIAIINAIKTDVQADGFNFEGGKQAKNQAEFFCKTQFFKDEFGKCLWDWLVYGDAYLWKGGLIANKRTKDKIRQIFKIDIDLDEDQPTMIKYVPTTTMNILHDGRKIINFRQSVSGQQPITFNVEEIIHAKLLTNKGKVYGFSPTQACLSEMSVLSYLKDYAGNFFRNGGVPDWMFNLPNEMAGSPNHKNLIEMLKKYKHPQRTHGNLVFAGEVTAQQLGNNLDQVDITNNAIYFASVLAVAHNMPVSRVASLIGAKVKISAGGDDLANEGYWSIISKHQDSWETWLNTQLFEPFFNCEMRFNRAWKTNEVKEQQRNQIAIMNIDNLNKQLARWDKQVNLGYLQRHLYIKDSDLEEANEEFNLIQQKPKGFPPEKQPDNLELRRGAATEGYRAEKQKEEAKSVEYKSKITHLCNKELFFEKFQKFVKSSSTRQCYYYILNNKLNAIFATPEENFKLEINLNELNPSELNEIKTFSKETKGVE